jgi:hypothetical protein
MEKSSRDSTTNGKHLWSCWARLLILGLAVSSASVFIVTRSVIEPLAARLDHTIYLGPLLFVAEVHTGPLVSARVVFAIVSIMVLLPIVRFRLATVIASLCGLLAWIFLGKIASGIGC